MDVTVELWIFGLSIGGCVLTGDEIPWCPLVENCDEWGRIELFYIPTGSREWGNRAGESCFDLPKFSIDRTFADCFGSIQGCRSQFYGVLA